MAADFEAAHPVVSAASGLVGGVAATAPLASTTLGARLLGLTGSTLPAQVAQGALSGAGINAADALVRGQDPLKAAEVGGGLGAAAPVAGRVVGALAEPVINTVRGIVDPAGEAARRVAGAVGRDVRAGTAGLSDPEFGAAQAAGQPVNALDLGGETTRALARSAANTSPEGRDLLNRAINDRFESQAQRVSDSIAATAHYPDAPAQQAALEQAGRVTNNAAYAAARAHPNAQAMWDEGFEQLMQAPAMQEAARGATRTGGNQAALQGFPPVVRPFEFHDT
jgi:hypothetical protein